MAKAIVDPEDLRKFAVDLRRFGSEVQAHLARINLQFSKVGDTWQDQEHAKFAQEFQLMVRVLSKFIASTEQQAPLLLRKAESIRAYLDQR